MALTIAVKSKQDVGNGEIVVADITFDTSYPTGGEPLTAKDLGFRVGSELWDVQTSQEGVRAFEWEQDANLKHTGKFLAYEEDGGGVLAEVADTTNLSAVTVRVSARGR